MTGQYLIRRLLETGLILLVIITLNFFLPRILPGNPAERFYSDPRVSPEDKVKILEQFGLDKPLHEQYWRYLRNLARGNLGVSYTYRKPVLEVIASRIPWTLALTLTSMLLSVGIGFVLGAYAGWHRGGWLDLAMLSLSIVFSAIPSFWMALVLILVFAFYFPLLPAYGVADAGLRYGLNLPYLSSVARHAVLPVTTLTVVGIVSNAVLVRTSMIETMGQGYVVVARAKGLRERTILFRHVLRNALLPVVTSLGMRLSGLLGGMVVIETIFSWQGMGMLILDASRSLDYPLMQGIFVLLAILTVSGNFLADLLYGIVDPRVRLG